MPSANPDGEIEPIPSVKDLACSDPSLRRKCLTSILSHLSTRKSTSKLTTTQNQQVWRGFSVALYMHDSKNQLSVQKLIETLASTFQTMYTKDMEYLDSSNYPGDEDAGPGNVKSGRPEGKPEAETLPWLTSWHSAFWETLCREWSKIDQWRMNKYLLLIRFVIREIFGIMFSSLSDEELDRDTLQSTIDVVFREYPLSPSKREVPDGLRLHVLDVWVDELQMAHEIDKEKDDQQDSREGKSRKRKRASGDDAGKNDEEDSEDGDAKDAEDEEDGDDDDDEEEAAEQQSPSNPRTHTPSEHTPKSPLPTQTTQPQTQATSAKKLAEKLMDPIRSLAKESVSKSVRTRAKEIIRIYDEERIS